MALKDLPDYTREMVIRYEGGFIGLEELSARLGSIVPWDMQGNIVLMEDFESEETEWLDNSYPAGSTTSRSSRHKFSGDWSMKLYSIGIVGAYAERWRPIHYPGLSKYALFNHFGWDNTCKSVYIGTKLRSGTKETGVEVWYDLPNKTLYVETTGGVLYAVDTNLNLSPDDFTWYPCLVTFDTSSGYYDKLYFADKEYDISSILMNYTSLGENPGGFISFGAQAEGIVAFTCYVDDIIIAKNVP